MGHLLSMINSSTEIIVSAKNMIAEAIALGAMLAAVMPKPNGRLSSIIHTIINVVGFNFGQARNGAHDD